jgi:hypothetical protein
VCNLDIVDMDGAVLDVVVPYDPAEVVEGRVAKLFVENVGSLGGFDLAIGEEGLVLSNEQATVMINVAANLGS